MKRKQYWKHSIVHLHAVINN